MPTDTSNNHLRLLAIIFLLAAIAAMFVWAGTITPNPAMNNYPGDDEVGPHPDGYVAQQVELSGTVVATDPVVVEIHYGLDGTREITIADLEEPVAEGQHLTAFGPLTDSDTLAVETAFVRSPWEAWFMYAASFLGGLWVLGRVRTQWRLDRDRLAFVPHGDDSDA